MFSTYQQDAKNTNEIIATIIFFIIYLLYSTFSKILDSTAVTSKYPLLITAVSITLSYPEIIAIHTAKNSIHSIFLKIPLGLDAHFAFEINLCHNLAIRSDIIFILINH